MPTSSKNKKNRFTRFSSHKRTYSIIVVALLFGLIGSYFLSRSNAASGDVYYDNSPSTTHREAGESYSLTLYADVPYQPLGREQHLGLGFARDSNTTQYVGFTCGFASEACGLNVPAGAGNDRDLDTCIDISPAAFGASHVAVAIVHLKAKVTGTFNNAWAVFSTWSCAYEASPGTSAETGDGATADSGTDDGNNGTGTGSGSSAGGGGSSATNQSAEPNPLPADGAQGDETKQPKIEPSPFYDGKLYEPGSDLDDQTFGTISIAGHKFESGLFYLTGGLAVLGVSGFFGWRHRRRVQGVIRRIAHR